MPKYVCLQRSLPGARPREPPSPEQMQAMHAQFTAWRESLRTQLTDLGGWIGDR